MNELLQNMIPMSMIYILPLIPLFIFFWILQCRVNRTLVRSSTLETQVAAKELAEKLLEKANICNVPIERGEDYTINAYLPEDRKILLSPDTFDQKDITAIGLALRAAGKTIFAQESPEMANFLDWIKRSVLIFFWIVFTVMSFGLMGNSFVTIIIGYVMGAGLLALFFTEIRMESGINRRIYTEIKNSGTLTDEQLVGVLKVLRADAMKF